MGALITYSYTYPTSSARQSSTHHPDSCLLYPTVPSHHSCIARYCGVSVCPTPHSYLLLYLDYNIYDDVRTATPPAHPPSPCHYVYRIHNAVIMPGGRLRSARYQGTHRLSAGPARFCTLPSNSSGISAHPCPTWRCFQSGTGSLFWCSCVSRSMHSTRFSICTWTRDEHPPR